MTFTEIGPSGRPSFVMLSAGSRKYEREKKSED